MRSAALPGSGRSMSFLMNDDAAAAEGGCRIRAVRCAELVVINDGIVVGLVPNFDAELVHATAAIDLAVDGREHEAVVASVVHGPGPFVLAFGSRDHQPFVAGAVEVKAGDLEFEFGLAIRDCHAFLVFGNEPEVRFARKARICCVSASR